MYGLRDVEIIRRYPGRLGWIVVEKYTNRNGSVEYCVSYRAMADKGITDYWTRDKVEAVTHAQFLSGKY